MISSPSTDRIVAGQVDAFAAPTPVVLGGQPVLYAHSAASDAREMLGLALTAVRSVTRTIVERCGLNVASVSCTGSFGTAGLATGDPIGNCAGRLEAAAAAHEARFDTLGPIGGIGTSMGTTDLLVYALEHPGDVAWLVLFCPVFDPAGYYAADTAGSRSAIGTGWGVTYPTPLPAEADVYDRITEGGLDGLPVLWIGSSDDPYSTGDFAEKYAEVVAATGGHQQALGAVGHGNGAVAAADLDAVVEFIFAT